jgi:hypothetical protein
MSMAATETYKCKNCGSLFTARVADRKRGWAKYCSKSCKAIKQEKRTGQYKSFLAGTARRKESGEELFADAHLFSNEEHDCNKE